MPTNPPERTPTARLATMHLKRDVVDWARSRHDAGLSWHRIALELRDLSKGQISVTDETVRLWVQRGDAA